MTLDVMSNSPFVSQANARQFGKRIEQIRTSRFLYANKNH